MAGSKKTISTDVLVIGGGISGMCAAIKASEQKARVVVVEKADPRWGGQVPFAGGAFFCLFPDDDRDGWVKLNMEDGQDLVDQKWLLKFGEETYPRYHEMMKWDVPFKRDAKGELVRSEIARVMYMHGNIVQVPNPAQIQVILVRRAIKNGVKIINKAYVPELIIQDGRVVGAVGIDLNTGEFYSFMAKAVILACGGCDWGVRRLFTPPYGEAISMAYHAGAEMRNAEFGNQYTPVEKDTETWTWANRLLENKDGERIIQKHFPGGVRETGFQTIYSMYKEITAGKGPIYQNFTQEPQLLEKMLEVGGVEGYSLVHHMFEKGVDLTRERVEMKPALSAHLGPIKIDLNCETTVPGFYATGDASFGGCAFQGTLPPGSHPSYPLAFAVVSGCLAGEAAGKKVPKAAEPRASKRVIERVREEIFAPLKVRKGFSPHDGIFKIQEVVYPLKYNFVRSEERLREALRKIGELKANRPKLQAKDPHEVMRCCQVKSMVLCGELQYRAALMRTETRGGHIREDYPERDDKNWLKWIEIKKEGEETKLWTVPVPQV